MNPPINYCMIRVDFKAYVPKIHFGGFELIDISYDICAVLISFVILINIIRTKRSHNLQNVSFQLMIILNGLTALFDISKRIVMEYSSTVYVEFIDFCTLGYFITHVCSLTFLYIYAISLIKNWNDISKLQKIMSVVPVAAGLVLILTNKLTSWIYHIEPDGTYVREKGILVLYAIMLYYLLHIIFILVRYRKIYSYTKRVTLYSVLGIMAGGVLIQFLFPDFLVETVCNAVGLLLLFFVVQNPHNQLDHNTGMFNRVAFGSAMRTNFANGRKFSLVFLMIENLTDVSLQERENFMGMVASYLKSLGKTYTVYRLDDNSFCVSVPEKDEEFSEHLSEDIMAQFQKRWPGFELEIILKPRILSLSFPGEIKKMEELRAVFGDFKERKTIENKIYRSADFELKKIVRAAQVSNALVRALEENRFELNYTPVFDSKKTKLFAAESNLKFLDSELGYVYEEEIQQLAEKGGKMAHLSEWILDQTCVTIAENHLERTRLRMIFVRLSTGLCLQYGYEDIILEIIRRHNIPPSMICFLVSEYTVSRGAQLLRQGMRKLKENGISFCLENYGSGYTNLSSLYELPFDFIEISKLVIAEAMKKEKAKIILESTLALAKSLQIHTIVAGVNSEEQKKILDSMPCDYALGAYYLGQMEKKEFLRLIEDNPLNSMEGRHLVEMRMEEKLVKEKEEAEKRAELARARKRKNPSAPRPRTYDTDRKEAD